MAGRLPRGFLGPADAQHGVNRGDDFVRLDGLGEIAVGAAFQAVRLVLAANIDGRTCAAQEWTKWPDAP